MAMLVPFVSVAALIPLIQPLLSVANAGRDTTINFPVSFNPCSLTSADFNNDSKPDLAITNYNMTNVSILLNNGLGSFGAITNFGILGSPAVNVISKDFNLDGNMDLALANQSSNNISVLLGTGTGSFSPAISYSVGSSPISIVSSDFNGDNKFDLAIANICLISLFTTASIASLNGLPFCLNLS